MFRNYFKTAYRSLLRNKSYTLINIAGLAVGIAVCIIIFLLITFETSFDNFHPQRDRIYRLITEFHNPDGVRTNAGVPFPTPNALKNDYGNIQLVPLLNGNNDQIQVLNADGTIMKKFKERQGFVYSTPEFFNVFAFQLMDGSAASLKDPNSIILSRSIAEKYFGDWKNAIGRSIKHNNGEIFKVSGIMKDVPDNTDFQLKMVASFEAVRNQFNQQDWTSINSNYNLYARLPKEVSYNTFSSQMAGYLKNHRAAGDRNQTQLKVQPLDEVHYDEESGNISGRSTSKKLLGTLRLIALFILIIACVNFINLSTAQAVNRSKEVGVRKVLGSNRNQLQIQFYCETILIVAISVLLALGIALLALPGLNSILSLPLSLHFSSELIIFIISLTILVTLLAGFYPALVLSGFSPITALKSKVVSGSTKGISLRRALVVCQFIIAQSLIIGTILLVKQMDYFRNTSMGFAKEAIITVPFPSDSAGITKIDYLRNQLTSMKEVHGTSFSFASPADDGNWYSDLTFNHAPESTDFPVNLKWADTGYIPLYNIELVAGRNLQASDTVREFLVNQTLARSLGITRDADMINKDISMWDNQLKGQVVGVMKDFHTSSFRSQLRPVLVSTYKRNYNIANVKIDMANVSKTLASIGSLWDKVFPEFVYEYQFVDQKIANFYAEEEKLSRLYKIFASLAIFLSCLGLYGLASFMAVQRLKEVGIRKVLGASVENIVMLFSREFVFLILVAFAIAAPLAWYFLNQWLQNFQYRTGLSWWIFLAAALASILIAITTVSFKAIAAARSNPVKSLRSE